LELWGNEAGELEIFATVCKIHFLRLKIIFIIRRDQAKYCEGDQGSGDKFTGLR